MRKTRILFLLSIILLTGSFLFGQVRFTTLTGSREIGKSEYLQVEFRFENAGKIEEFRPPDFAGFRLMQEPVQSSQTNNVNGHVSEYQSVIYVLQPVKTGKFTIKGAMALVDGKKMQSNSVTVRVTTNPSGNKGNNNNPGNPFAQLGWPDPAPAVPEDLKKEWVLRPGEDVKEKISKNLFVKVEVDRNNCYVGEPIVATYKLYSRLRSEFQVTKSPSLNGFSLYDMVDPSIEPSSVEKLNGKSFTVHILRKAQLVPLQSGTVDLEPMEVENTVHFVKEGWEENNTAGSEVEENATVNTKPLTITVKPLPVKDKPADFSGGVGKFSIASALVNRNVNAQDEADLKITVSGSGNLSVISAPPVKWPPGMDVFNRKTKEDINRMTVPLSGIKTFDYIFTTGGPGHYTIPPVTLSYFDPSAQAYKRIQSNPLDFEVMPPSKKIGLPSGAIVAASEDGSLKGMIDRHLESLFAILILSGLAFYLWRQNLRLKRAEKEKEMNGGAVAGGPQGSPGGLAGKGSPGGSTGSAGSSGQGDSSGKIGSSGAGSPGSRIERAEWMAIAFDPLSDIRERLDNGDYPGFYRELNRTMWKAVADKLDLPASELNKYNVVRKLEAKGWDASTTLSLEHLLNECEMNLYTPDYDTYNMQQLLRQAESLLGILISNTSY